MLPRTMKVLKLKWRTIIVFLVLVFVVGHIYSIFSVRDDVVQIDPRAISTPISVRSRDVLTAKRTNQRRVLSRADEYCNSPFRDAVEGAEGEVSNGYQLEQVQIIIRHGDRAPMVPNSDQTNSITCKMEPNSTQETSYLDYLRRYGHTRIGGYFRTVPLSPRAPICDPAQLTPTGVRQLLKLGAFLNRIYIQKFNLLKEELDPSEIHLRSSRYSRTYQSALAFLYGFLPDFKISKLQLMDSPVSFCNQKLFSCACPRYHAKHGQLVGRLRREFAEEFKQVFDDVIRPYFRSSEVAGTRGLLDSLMTPYCHSKPFCDRCNRTRILETLWTIENSILARISSRADVVELERLFVLPFLREIVGRMRNRTAYVSPRSRGRFVLYSGHDVTISALATTLGLYDDVIPRRENVWPRFASRLVLELYSTVRSDQVKYFFRLLFDGRDVTGRVRFCRRRLRSGLCPLRRFADFVAEDTSKKSRNSCRS